jgi:hypothetical protein
MKKKSKVIMILTIIFISIIYSFILDVKPAKADCVDVTQNPCLCDIFDVPYDGWTMHFLWLMYRRDNDKLNYLRTLKIQIDSCNLTPKSNCKNISSLEDCLYFKHAKYYNNVEYGFNKIVKAGDTITINDFDTRNTKILEIFEKLDSALCKFKILVDYFDANKNNYLVCTILFESYYEGIKLMEFRSSMYAQGYGSIISDLYYVPVFDYSTNLVEETNHNIGFVISQSNSDELLINNNQFEKNAQVEIYDLLGICQISLELNIATKVIDISNLPTGVYFIKIGDKVEKFVKM